MRRWRRRSCCEVALDKRVAAHAPQAGGVDAQRALVGGINYSADRLGDFGPQAKQDYAVELEGPIVDDIHRAIAALPYAVRASGSQEGGGNPV